MEPTKLPKAALMEVLRQTLEAVTNNDSFEGSIEYTCMDEKCGREEFMVRAVVRVGNSEGQGGTMIVGEQK